MSAAQLKSNADSGDLAYLALYAERLAAEGRYYPALGILGRAVERGSIYALYSVSDVYASDSKFKNPLSSRTYLRLAYLAGDSKAAIVLAGRFPRFNSSVENAIVDKEAAHLHNQLLKGRTSRRP